MTWPPVNKGQCQYEGRPRLKRTLCQRVGKPRAPDTPGFRGKPFPPTGPRSPRRDLPPGGGGALGGDKRARRRGIPPPGVGKPTDREFWGARPRERNAPGARAKRSAGGGEGRNRPGVPGYRAGGLRKKPPEKREKRAGGAQRQERGGTGALRSRRRNPPSNRQGGAPRGRSGWGALGPGKP